MERAGNKVRGLVGLALLASACHGTIETAGAHPPDGSAGGAGASTASGGGAGAIGSTGSGGTTATPGGSGGAVASPDGWPAFAPAASFGLRRLTKTQYRNTVTTLLGVSPADMPAIEDVSPAAGFAAIGASTASVSASAVASFEDAARFLAHAAFDPNGPRAKLLPCTPSGPSDTACFGKFIASFGPRAFRRALTSDETSRYAAAAASLASATGDPFQALEALTSAFLQAPSFLYLSEVGAPDPKNSARNKLTGDEMASRLSYFLTNDMPDDTLRSAAGSGALDTVDGVRAQAERLLATQAAHDAIGAFFGTLLSLDNLDSFNRPTALYPQFTPTLGAAMKQETALVIDDLVFAGNADYRHLFDQPDTFLNAELAALYGVAAPAGAGFARVTLPPSSHRAGLLGQAGVLAARDHADGTSPTRRGLFVLTRLLCQDLPLAPPAGLQIPQPPIGLLTARQKLEQHATNEVCASCHQITDPVGLSLEHFDAMGVWRDDDHGLAIDDRGVVDGQTYNGAIGLGAVLRDHPALGPCLLQSLYGVGVGHLATELDRAPFGALVDAWSANGGRVRATLSAIVASDGFRYTAPPEK